MKKFVLRSGTGKFGVTNDGLLALRQAGVPHIGVQAGALVWEDSLVARTSPGLISAAEEEWGAGVFTCSVRVATLHTEFWKENWRDLTIRKGPHSEWLEAPARFACGRQAAEEKYTEPEVWASGSKGPQPPAADPPPAPGSPVEALLEGLLTKTRAGLLDWHRVPWCQLPGTGDTGVLFVLRLGASYLKLWQADGAAATLTQYDHAGEVDPHQEVLSELNWNALAALATAVVEWHTLQFATPWGWELVQRELDA